MGAGEDLLLLQEVRVAGVHRRQQRQALELVLEDLEVVAQREGAVLGEQLRARVVSSRRMVRAD